MISVEDVLRSLQSLKVGKSSGPDKISGKILSLSKVQLAPILCKLFQQSLDTACIPKLWKTPEIVPVPKRTSPSCNNDYRPVALTSIMMKCLERIIKSR